MIEKIYKRIYKYNCVHKIPISDVYHHYKL